MSVINMNDSSLGSLPVCSWEDIQLPHRSATAEIKLDIRTGEGPLPGSTVGDPDRLLIARPAEHADLAGEWNTWAAWLTAGQTTVQPLLLTLQGAQLAWAPGRAVIVAEEHRYAAVRDALLDFIRDEQTLSSLEADLLQEWPRLEPARRVAQQFTPEFEPQQAELLKRGEQALLMRQLWAEQLPRLRKPMQFPPTLAAQVAERLRERAGQLERHENLGEQLEIVERVYEQCGQRINEYVYSRKETTLEWIIIVLLAVEVILILIELMPAATAVTPSVN